MVYHIHLRKQVSLQKFHLYQSTIRLVVSRHHAIGGPDLAFRIYSSRDRKPEDLILGQRRQQRHGQPTQPTQPSTGKVEGKTRENPLTTTMTSWKIPIESIG